MIPVGDSIEFAAYCFKRKQTMHAVRAEIANLTLDEVADWVSNITPDSINEMAGKAEFMLRQTRLQERATDAAIESARFARHNAFYMFLTVVILAISSTATLVLTIIQHIR
jgi:t-SNARE complex subunit (syntaxin)